MTAKSPPRLIVAISIDQFGADLFAQYRATFTGGLQRLTSGAVFPSGYQSHAASETCPGHSTILTGGHPARTGIIANDWIDQRVTRADKTVYCAEDERVAGSSSDNYTASPVHLLVPTLGELLKARNKGSRNVAVAGKDRAALMMGGAGTDEIWYWGGKKAFVTLPGRKPRASVAALNQDYLAAIAAGSNGLPKPAHCEAVSRPIPVGGRTVGDGNFVAKPGDEFGFRGSPALDAATLDLAETLVRELKLGKGEATDTLAIGLSATDYIGHAYGSGGGEMCLQVAALDTRLGQFFARLDEAGLEYVVMLTADHGVLDLPERARDHAMPMASRVDPALNVKDIGAAIAADLGLEPATPLLLSGGAAGDFYLNSALTPDARNRVKAAAIARLAAFPQVEAVLDGAELEKTPLPTGPVELWSLADRARASYYPGRSGDLIVILKKAVTPIANPTRYVATHGSVWDYDRRVPILFWRSGMAGFEQSLSVESVDIMPTLAALVGLKLPAGAVDGRCLDLDSGPASTCPPAP
ncbi:MAG: alkaline phosphatase family protein [Parasphingorhabdus sp.]|nr:alkaline phosphatase family protein [Parasphingorhabdus sp.]